LENQSESPESRKSPKEKFEDAICLIVTGIKKLPKVKMEPRIALYCPVQDSI